LLFLAGCLPGCLHRDITYSIGADGTAVVHFVARGDKADIERGDLMPPKDSWTVKESEVAKEEGKKEYVYDATRSFARVSEIPPSYATPATRFPEAYLHTPVQFQVKDEENAKVYEFTLTYKARKWKEYQDLQTEIAGPKLMDLVNRYGFDKLTQDERLSFVAAFIRWQLRLIYDRVAAAASKAALPTEKAQAILRQTDLAFDTLSSEAAVRKILAQPQDTWGKALEEKKKEAQADSDKILQEVLGAPQDAETLKKVRDDIAAAMLEWDVTNALGAQSFTVKVQMPGSIVKTNAEKVEGNGAQWNFGGDKFHDTDYVMSVTSRVTK
jgi:hypothetical protein